MQNFESLGPPNQLDFPKSKNIDVLVSIGSLIEVGGIMQLVYYVFWYKLNYWTFSLYL